LGGGGETSIIVNLPGRGDAWRGIVVDSGKQMFSGFHQVMLHRNSVFLKHCTAESQILELLNFIS
jgi:hypothetical protein